MRQQATSNTKEQFANSPDLKTELLNAIMGALDAHTLMSTQALNSITGFHAGTAENSAKGFVSPNRRTLSIS